MELFILLLTVVLLLLVPSSTPPTRPPIVNVLLLLCSHLVFLGLQSVGINQRAPIREGTEYIISCVAHGSPQIAFRWFKDGVFINTTRSNRLVWQHDGEIVLL